MLWRECIIVNRLSEFRNATGLTQTELAVAVGVSRQAIYAIEKGQYNPSLTLAYRIARFFNVSVYDIFIEEEI